jgi:hypothetical protein
VINHFEKKNFRSENGEKKIKDRFLNMKTIIADEQMDQDDEFTDDELGEESSAEDVDQNKATESNSNDEYYSDSEDEFDDASKWQDFDIETLNFDKFIKDHQTTNSKSIKSSDVAKELSSTSSKKQQPIVFSQFPSVNKRKQDGSDPVEIKAKRRRNRVLPIEIQGLMGEANLAYARGETNKAIDVCLEVIKYAPKACEPYQLLSLLYSEMGQNDKALRVGLIAAQLNKDPDEWIQLISQALIEGDVELVLFCYNK